MRDEGFHNQGEKAKPVESESLRQQWDSYYLGTLLASLDRTAFAQGIADLSVDPVYADRHSELQELYGALKLADHQKRRGEYLPFTWPEQFRSLIEQFLQKPGGEEPLPSPGSEVTEQPVAPTVVAETFAQPENTETPIALEVKAEIVALLGTVESIDGLRAQLDQLADEAPGATAFGVMSAEKRDEIIHQVAQAKLQIDFYSMPQPDVTQISPDGPFSVGEIANLLNKS